MVVYLVWLVDGHIIFFRRFLGCRTGRCFEFGTPYAEIALALGAEAPAHYHRVGVLALAQRAARCKAAPQVRGSGDDGRRISKM